MATVSLLLSSTQIAELVSVFDKTEFVTPPAYASYQIRTENCVITIYGSLKVVFQGKDAEIYASKYSTVSETKKEVTVAQNTFPQCGSDEVGTGDYFGPICVVACAVDKVVAKKIAHLRVQDSKLLTDEKIMIIGKELTATIPYSICILDNEKYNDVHQVSNMNEIKAKLHNQCYLNLENKLVKLPNLRIVDQFVAEATYYRYLRNEKHVINHLTFETKAESKYLSVACASIIARYIFLQQWEKMEHTYNMSFPKGASAMVDEKAKEFVSKYGFEKLNKVAKVHFKNTTKAELKKTTTD